VSRDERIRSEIEAWVEWLVGDDPSDGPFQPNPSSEVSR